MSVLVVDDDRVVLDSCRRILKAEGYEVVVTSSAKEAVARLREREFELLLVDVIMPEYDGIYLIGTVRQERPNLPILVMSGYTDNSIEATRYQVVSIAPERIRKQGIANSTTPVTNRSTLSSHPRFCITSIEP